MRVKTVKLFCRSAVALGVAAVVCHPPAGQALDGSVGSAAMLEYGVLTLFVFAAFPQVRRSDLTGALFSFVAVLEGMRALFLWRSDMTALLQGLAGVGAVYGLSFTERFRSGARRASEADFTLSEGHRRRRTDSLDARLGPAL